MEKIKEDKKVAVNFKMQEDLKNDWMEICDELGMSMTVAITLLAKQMVRDRKLPFTPNALSGNMNSDATKTDSGIVKQDTQLTIELAKNNHGIERLLSYLEKLQESKRDSNL